MALILAPAAWAGDRVLVVGEDSIRERWDPMLPPDVERISPAPPPAVAAGGPSVKQSLARALAQGSISRRQHVLYTLIYKEALAARSRRGVARRCRNQIGRVLRILAAVSANGDLGAARMRPLFLTLRRNAEFWVQEPRVRSGQRVTFERDPLVLQHYAGYGIQIQPLGSAGKANGLWKQCDETPRLCREARLHALLESLLTTASQRAGGKAWEYWFPFGGGYPPWASGMAQATAMQALSRGAIFFGEPRFMIAARAALPLFREPPPVGVRARTKRGHHFLLYSFAPRLRVLNGFLQAVTGLHDYAKLSGDRRARRLFRSGDRAARRETPRYDTGKWSYYALPNKNRSTIEYHALVTGFLENLCDRTGARVYCRIAKRFTRYLNRRGGPPSPPSGEPPSGPRCGYL